jgi:hypothetical protein
MYNVQLCSTQTDRSLEERSDLFFSKSNSGVEEIKSVE